jgi:mRNA-degrading endonuclease YafQ of YafQ-DinJ toxin-antitoxin module
LLLKPHPYNPSLRLHALRGSLQGLHSASIYLNYEITLDVLIDSQRLIPFERGSHDVVDGS